MLGLELPHVSKGANVKLEMGTILLQSIHIVEHWALEVRYIIITSYIVYMYSKTVLEPLLTKLCGTRSW